MRCALQVDRAARSTPRRRVIAWLALAAVALHAVLIGATRLWWPSIEPMPQGRAAAPSMVVRSVEPSSTLAVPSPVVVPADASLAAALALPPPDRAPAGPKARRPVAPIPAIEPGASRARVEQVEPRPTPVETVVTSADPVSTAAAAPADRTEIAPSIVLRYRVERGARTGSAVLDWRVVGAAYEARLEIVYDDSERAALRQFSIGGFDAAGIAPLRYTDRRLRGAMQAANFVREAGAVTFSGPSTRLALPTGAQDRLSWILQLAAVARADPARAVAGGEIVFPVIGTRGDQRAWRFRFEAWETVPDGAGASVDAAKWIREPIEPYDSRVEVWLDPNRHHLPARLRMGPPSGADGLVLSLAE